MIEGVTQEQLTSLLAVWRIGYIRLDEAYRVEEINPEISRITGCVSRDIIGKRLWDFWPDAQEGHAGEVIRRGMEEREGNIADIVARTPSGDEFAISFRVHPWGNGIAIFTLDVSALRRAEAEKAELEDRFLLASQATLDVLYEWDIVNDVSRLTDEGAKMLNVPAQVVSPAQILLERLHPEDLDATIASLQDALKSGAPKWESVHRVKVQGRYITVRDRAFILYGDDGKPVRAIGALSDVTEVQKAQDKIAALQSELIHMSRVSAMGTMASVLGHELNQPLAAVGSYLAGAERLLSLGGEANVKASLDGIRQARGGIARAGEIIRRLRTMTKKAPSRRERMKVGAAIKSSIALALIGRQHLAPSIEVDVQPNLEVDGDPVQIEQVLINLIRNALDANEEVKGGNVHISAHRVDDEFVEIAVTDEGSGIPRDLLGSLFDFFMSTKAEGLGIGLPISRTIIEAHGGKITVENREERGAISKIVLPRIPIKMAIIGSA